MICEKNEMENLALPKCGTGYFQNDEICNGLLILVSNRVYDYSKK